MNIGFRSALSRFIFFTPWSLAFNIVVDNPFLVPRWCASKMDNFLDVWEANHRRQSDGTNFFPKGHEEPICRALRLNLGVSNDHERSNSINLISQRSHELLSINAFIMCLHQLQLAFENASSTSKLPDRNFANQFWHWRSVNTSSPYTSDNFFLAWTAFLSFR